MAIIVTNSVLISGFGFILIGVDIIIRIILFGAFRAYAVGEFGFRMVPDIGFDPVPVSFIVADLFAMGAYGEKAL
jgi:hypothetical protein